MALRRSRTGRGRLRGPSSCSLLKIDPGRIARTAVVRGLDEAHSGETVGKAGVARLRGRFAANGVGEVAIDVGKSFEITLGMTGRQPRDRHRRMAEIFAVD